MKEYLELSLAVKAALAAGKPVVALESTIISHGMPYPQNVETAIRVEEAVRDSGATPATIAILGGKLKDNPNFSARWNAPWWKRRRLWSNERVPSGNTSTEYPLSTIC